MIDSIAFVYWGHKHLPPSFSRQMSGGFEPCLRALQVVCTGGWLCVVSLLYQTGTGMNSFTNCAGLSWPVSESLSENVGSVSATEVHSNTRGDCLGSVHLGMLQAITAQLSIYKPSFPLAADSMSNSSRCILKLFLSRT